MILWRLIGSLFAGMFWLIAGIVALVVLSLLPMCLGLPFYLGPFGALLLLVTGAIVLQVLRRRRGVAVLHYVAQCVRLNLPLPRMLSAARRGESWAMRRRLERLSKALAGGETLEDAIGAHVPEVPDRAVAMIGAATHSGRLPAILEQIIEANRREQRQDQTEHIITFTYQLLVLLTSLSVLGVVWVFILPQYVEIFEDFGTEMPWATQLLMALKWSPHLEMLFFVTWLSLLMVAGWSVRTLLHGRPGERLVEPVVVDPLIWCLPVFGGMARDRGLADACQTIAGGLGVGLPLEHAVDEATTLSMSTVLNRRLKCFADALRAGHPLSDAVRRARLPRLMRGMLGSVHAGIDAQPVFDFLHRYYTGRYERAAIVVRQFGGPLLVLLVAVLVGFIAYTLFVPLVHLINSTNIYYFGEGL